MYSALRYSFGIMYTWVDCNEFIKLIQSNINIELTFDRSVRHMLIVYVRGPINEVKYV